MDPISLAYYLHLAQTSPSIAPSVISPPSIVQPLSIACGTGSMPGAPLTESAHMAQIVCAAPYAPLTPRKEADGVMLKHSHFLEHH